MYGDLIESLWVDKSVTISGIHAFMILWARVIAGLPQGHAWIRCPSVAHLLCCVVGHLLSFARSGKLSLPIRCTNLVWFCLASQLFIPLILGNCAMKGLQLDLL